MAWLRIDDRFSEHRKILALGSRANRWTWLEVLEYCARHGSPTVPANIDERLRHVTPAFVARAVEVGLLDVVGDGYEVHDWRVYNAATVEDRVAAFLQSNPEATANEVHRAVGGKREIVLRTVAAMQGAASNPGSPGTGLGGSPGGSPAGSPRARARSSPVPTPEGTPASKPLAGRARPTDDAAEQPDELTTRRLAAAGWTPSQIGTAAGAELERAIAWLDHAERQPGIRSPGALAWSGFASAAWPPEARLEVAPGAFGTRSTRTVHAHVCPHCIPVGSTSFRTEHRLVEHVELVHDQAHGNGRHELDDEPAVNVEPEAHA